MVYKKWTDFEICNLRECVSTAKNVQKPKVAVLEVKKVMVTKNGPYFLEMRALCSQVVFRDFFSN